jgi:hypothetical protein
MISSVNSGRAYLAARNCKLLLCSEESFHMHVNFKLQIGS